MTIVTRPGIPGQLVIALLIGSQAAGWSRLSAQANPAAAEELGSLRGARVAITRPSPKAPLTYFAATMRPERLQEIKSVAPNVRIVIGLSPEEAARRAAEAHAADAAYARPPFLEAAKNLVWVHAGSAGVEGLLAIPKLVETDRIVLTNSRGVHGPAIADHAFAMLLALTRDLPFHLEGRAQGRWARQGSGQLRPVALQGRTLLVAGLGGIGTEIARRGHGFGMRVIGTRRSDDKSPDYIERVGKPSDFLTMLQEADVVALAVPLTPETSKMLDAKAFAAMKRGSYLINIGRGRLVDTDALLAALQSGHLAGAGLDVTDPEPLPPNHPLWKLPNVVITPHNAGVAELTTERGTALFLENLRRFDAGEPLLNVVDKRVGY
jgi:phosphoglycerate dehydrogenase-like enzyme